jgi:hypothetical protein
VSHLCVVIWPPKQAALNIFAWDLHIFGRESKSYVRSAVVFTCHFSFYAYFVIDFFVTLPFTLCLHYDRSSRCNERCLCSLRGRDKLSESFIEMFTANQVS